MDQGKQTEDPMELARAHVQKILAVGDPIREVMLRVLAPVAKRRAQEVAEDFQQAIAFVLARGRTVDDLAKDEAFCDLVFTATGAALRTHVAKKREALRNAIMNAGLPGRAPSREKQHMFVRLVDEFGELHVHVLHFLGDPEKWFKALGSDLPKHRGGVVDIMTTEARLEAVLPLAFPGYAKEISFVMLALEELERRGLVQDIEQGAIRAMGPTTFVAPKKAFTTPLGREFLLFISAPPDERPS
jgi:hypothetical protein